MPYRASTATIAADNAAFAGTQGQRIEAIASRIASGGQGDLAQKLRIAAAVELQSRAADEGGDLQLAVDWNLAALAAPGPQGSAATLTLRAAGDLLLRGSLSDGFGAGPIVPLAAPGVAPGGSIRLVAGADLGAANPLATVDAQALPGRGDLIVGRAATSAFSAPPVTLVRSSTGSIEMAAARDVRLRPGADDAADQRAAVRIVTTGQAVPAAEAAGFERITVRANDQFMRQGGSTVGPFFERAGAIEIQAGRDLVGHPAVQYNANGSPRATQYVTDWWYRQIQFESATGAAGTAFWTRPDLFGQGIASLGGGDIRLSAGRDLRDIDASTPFAGYAVDAAAAGGTPQSRWWAGGRLQAEAGRDVVAGLFFGGGAEARLSAGQSIRSHAEGAAPAGAYPSTQLLYGNTAWTVEAGAGLRLASPANPAVLAGAVQGIERQPRTDTAAHLAPQASARVVSSAGAVTLGSARPPSTTGSSPGAGAALVPDELQLAAPRGGVQAPVLAQRPVEAGQLQLLARDGVQVDALRVLAAEAAGAPVQPEAQAALTARFNAGTRQWSRTDRAAPAAPGGSGAQLVATEGDVQLAAVTSMVAAPLRMVAGRDLVVDGQLLVQHGLQDAAAPRQVSLLSAGRDLRLGALGGARLAGPGELVALAVRDIDFGRGAGIVTIGNQDNDQQLGAGGANVLLMAGAQWQDYAQAARRRMHLLGAGWQHLAAETLVQLEALRDGGTPLDAAALAQRAAEFAGLAPAQQRARVEALLGTAVVAAGIEAATKALLEQIEGLSAAATQAVADGRVQGSNRLSATPPVPGNEFLGGETLVRAGADAAEREAQREGVRSQLRQALQPRALAAVVAAAAEGLPAAERDALAAAVSPYGASLQRYVESRQGQPSSSVADAARRFEAMAPADQAIFLHQVLAAELAAAGNLTLGAGHPAARTAIEPAGRRTHYLRGFDAMDALFPGARPAGQISLANSQVKTSQGGSIRMSTPGGGINVGDLASGGIVKSAAEIGIVTVAGGAIDVAVRDSVEVNQSRIFTLADGDLMLWARLGNLDAGRGAKTVVGAPPPLVTINAQGQVVVDTSGSFSGSGIAVLDAGSTASLFAPLGEINAGDAGITVAGRLVLGANVVVSTGTIAAGQTQGGAAPIAAPSTAGLAGLAPGPTAAGPGPRSAAADEEEERRKRRARRQLLLEFLGFGRDG